MTGIYKIPFFVLACIACAAPAVFAQKVSTRFNDKFGFADHRRYAWRENRLMTRQNPDTNAVMDRKIVKAVNQTLADRGFVEVTDKPDLFVYYDGGGDQQLGAGGPDRANSTASAPNDPGPTYGLGNGPALAPSTWLKVNGQLVFHLIDAESRKPVWETTYNKTFHDPDKALRNMDKEVNELVTKSFKDFPPKTKR
jgi:Domain of unknown function (DUF4136)